MAWRRPGDKPLSEPVMFSLLTHICVTRTQCVKSSPIQSSMTVDMHYVPPTFWKAINGGIIFQEIRIFNQPLTYIHPDAFQGLYRVQYLFIFKCNLLRLSSLSWLHHIRKSLLFLCISIENNPPLAMYSTALSVDFPNLEYLALVDNRLNAVPDVSLIADTLIGLLLSKNRIISLRYLHNIRFSKLEILNLQTNRISVISINQLDMPMLRTLSLDDNLIKVIEPIDGILGGSSGPCGQLEVTLHDNPWQCDASILWLKEFTKVPALGPTYYTGPSCRVYIFDCPTLSCNAPLRLEGESLWTAGTKFPYVSLKCHYAGIVNVLLSEFSIKIDIWLLEGSFQFGNYSYQWGVKHGNVA